ncbi:MAG TPA: 2-C-methyl-D-erythritol 4-phosphate cytidylyltransferase [Vicinamibacteria bacterium]|nr:2-C-methyl-D-erythritol 4-phosphate cytidylyltransferase [Vicinamibacteria bacterium]
MISAFAVVVAGGRGSRFGGPVPKQFHLVLGRPLLAYSLSSFARCRTIERTVLVLPRAGFEEAERTIAPHIEGAAVEVVAGGDTRQASVWAGVSRLGDSDSRLVAVHDGARPLVSPQLIESVVEAASRHGGAIAAVPVVETLKEVSQDGFVQGTADRKRYWRAQTPQCFRLGLLRRAFDAARRDGFLGTDEASLVERLSAPIVIVPGEEQNLKVTSLHDVERMEYYIGQNARR